MFIHILYLNPSDFINMYIFCRWPIGANSHTFILAYLCKYGTNWFQSDLVLRTRSTMLKVTSGWRPTRIPGSFLLEPRCRILQMRRATAEKKCKKVAQSYSRYMKIEAPENIVNELIRKITHTLPVIRMREFL